MAKDAHCGTRTKHEPHTWDVGNGSPTWRCDGREITHGFTAADEQPFHQVQPTTHDEVNHPSHYTSGDARCSNCGHPIECIDVTRHMTFNLGSAVKYLWRLGKKDQSTPTTDLEKAVWYVNDEINRLKGAS